MSTFQHYRRNVYSQNGEDGWASFLGRETELRWNHVPARLGPADEDPGLETQASWRRSGPGWNASTPSMAMGRA